MPPSARSCPICSALAVLGERGNSARFGLLLVDGGLRAGEAGDPLSHLRAIAPEAAVVLLTNSNGLPAALRRMREQGVCHYLTKPVKRRELDSVIAEALSKTTLRASVEAPRVR